MYRKYYLQEHSSYSKEKKKKSIILTKKKKIKIMKKIAYHNRKSLITDSPALLCLFCIG